LLNHWGIAREDLEWLLKARYVADAVSANSATRGCALASREQKCGETYFIVTPAGTAFLEDVTTAVGFNPDVLVGRWSHEDELPRWDGQELRFFNRSLDIPLLHFGGNGKGNGVCWRSVAPNPHHKL
jgi:hypothetical protein